MIGILGGTFDPVHNAHLAMAQSALEHLRLARVLFMPTGAPKYRRPAVAAAEHRLAMLDLALKDQPKFRVDARELNPQATGYTVDTLLSLRAELGPQAELYFLMGADQLAQLPSWHRPEDVRRLAKLAVFARPGYAPAYEDVTVIPMQAMPVSASDIRARAARGDSLAGLVPPAVANYIERHRLYR